MFITKAFSIILAYTLLATVNGAVVHDNLSDSLAHFEAIKANLARAVNARDVNAPAAVPATIASDISDIVTASTDLASAITALVLDLSSAQLDASKRITDTIMSDTLTLSSDMSTIVADVAKLAADAGVPDNSSAPKFTGFPS